MKHLNKEILQKKGFKVTPGRVEILDIFSKSKFPLDAEAVSKKIKNLNEVTIYRTLKSMEKGGILKKVNLRKESVYYELNTDHHHHIVCTDCGKLEDFELCDIDSLTKKIIAKASNFKTVQQHALELFGICNTCVKN